MPKLSPMRQNMSEYSVVFLLCWPYPAGHGAPFRCGLYTQGDSSGEIFFLWMCLSVGDSFWVRDGDLCLLGLYVMEPRLA